eukprot:TRINITY_DN13755_c0_g1_i3.p1 TRINITY_DN13755_c0_g1~~TRINITY_DN13755_c0_g1_i3.p1  ORF type:complete len:897 (+),score=104.61 TRINITY_DN13755_c0_g1_i3:284-2692(+)
MEEGRMGMLDPMTPLPDVDFSRHFGIPDPNTDGTISHSSMFTWNPLWDGLRSRRREVARRFLRWRFLTLLVLMIAFNISYFSNMTWYKRAGEGEDLETPVPAGDVWKSYSVVNCCCLSFVLISVQFPPEIVFFSLSALFTCLDFITMEDWLSGFSNPATVGVAMLFVLSLGVSTTRALDAPLIRFLGVSRRVWVAQVKVSIMAMVLSAVLNNTVVLSILMPVVRRWCSSQSLDVRHFWLPIGCSIILGGCVTAVGNTAALIAISFTSVEVRDRSYQAGPFSITPTGLSVCVVGLFLIVIFSRLFCQEDSSSLRTTSQDGHSVPSLSISQGPGVNTASPQNRSVDQEASQSRTAAFTTAGLAEVEKLLPARIVAGEYALPCRVRPSCDLVGSVIHRSFHSSMFGEMRPLWTTTLDEDGRQRWIELGVRSFKVQEGQQLIVAGSATAFCKFRHLTFGWDVMAENLTKDLLGGGRSRRCCFECVLHGQSELVDRPWVARTFATRYKAVLLAIRRQGCAVPVRADFSGIVPKATDVLLVEGFPDILGGSFVEAGRDFATVVPIANSGPPRQVGAADATRMDRVRAFLIILGIPTLVLLAFISPWIWPDVRPRVPLLAAVLCMVLIGTKAVRYKQAVAALGNISTQLLFMATAFSIKAALLEANVPATAAVYLSRFCKLLADGDETAACFIGSVCMAIITQMCVMLTSPTISVVICLDLGYAMARQLSYIRRVYTVVVVLASSMTFATPWVDSVLVACVDAGNYDRSRIFSFGSIMQVVLTTIVCVGARFFEEHPIFSLNNILTRPY